MPVFTGALAREHQLKLHSVSLIAPLSETLALFADTALY